MKRRNYFALARCAATDGELDLDLGILDITIEFNAKSAKISSNLKYM